jgi:hypothetical protein
MAGGASRFVTGASLDGTTFSEMRCHSNRAMNRRPESDRQPMIAQKRKGPK